MRTYNEQLVFNAIRDGGSVTRASIVRATELSYPTVATLIQRLGRDGLVRELDGQVATGGRPSGLIEIEPTARFVVGVDLSTERVRAALVNFRGDITSEVRQGAALVSRADVSGAIAAEVDALLRSSGRSGQRDLMGIGVGVRGSFEPAEELVYLADDDTPVYLARDLSAQFSVPVLVDHNYNVALLGEAEFGVARKARSAIFVNIGIGLSSALLLDGQIYRGASRNAGELGHISVEPNGPTCPTCERPGCLELYASARAVLGRARQLGVVPDEAQADKLGLEQPIRELARRADAGEPLAQEVFSTLISYTSIALANLVNILEPEAVIMGGLIGSNSSHVFAQVRQQVLRQAWLHSVGSVRFVQTQSNGDEGIRGAASLAINHWFPRAVPGGPLTWSSRGPTPNSRFPGGR